MTEITVLSRSWSPRRQGRQHGGDASAVDIYAGVCLRIDDRSVLHHASSRTNPKKNNAIQGATDRALSDYIARVRQQSEAEPHAMGSNLE